jgi:HKD family nuclease
MGSPRADGNSARACLDFAQWVASNMPDVELRVFEGPLHSKGYLFGAADLCTIVVGSSNLTQGALLANSEWNLLIRTLERGAIWDQTQARSFWRHTEII